MKYEIMVILDPSKTDKGLEKLNEEIKSIFDDNGLSFVEEDVWGHRDLAYKIKGHTQGYYVVMNFEGEPEGVPAIHKELRLLAGLVRYMLVKMPEDYALMRYDKPAPKKKASKLSAHAEELQKKVTRKSTKKVEEEPAEEAEEIQVEEVPEAPEVPAEEPVNEDTQGEEAAPAEAEEKSDKKLDEKLQAIIDDADIDL